MWGKVKPCNCLSGYVECCVCGGLFSIFKCESQEYIKHLRGRYTGPSSVIRKRYWCCRCKPKESN